VAFGQSETHSRYTVRDNRNLHWLQSYRVYDTKDKTD